MQPNFDALLDNLADTVREFQIKLGSAREAVGVYYPPESLNRLLGTALDEAGLATLLADFAAYAGERLGPVAVSAEAGRFCLRVSEEGAARASQTVTDSGFLRAFIEAVSAPGPSIESLLAVFRRYSDQVVCRELKNGEFDYLVYFEDGKPDDYRYCIEFEGPMAVYHRFTPADYEALSF